MCTGRPPYRGDSPMAVLNRICHEPHRPLDEVNPDVPVELAELVDRLLAKDPAHAFANANEVEARCAALLADVQQGRRRRHRNWLRRLRRNVPLARRVAIGTAAALVCMLVGAWVAWLALGHKVPPNASREPAVQDGKLALQACLPTVGARTLLGRRFAAKSHAFAGGGGRGNCSRAARSLPAGVARNAATPARDRSLARRTANRRRPTTTRCGAATSRSCRPRCCRCWILPRPNRRQRSVRPKLQTQYQRTSTMNKSIRFLAAAGLIGGGCWVTSVWGQQKTTPAKPGGVSGRLPAANGATYPAPPGQPGEEPYTVPAPPPAGASRYPTIGMHAQSVTGAIAWGRKVPSDLRISALAAARDVKGARHSRSAILPRGRRKAAFGQRGGGEGDGQERIVATSREIVHPRPRPSRTGGRRDQVARQRLREQIERRKKAKDEIVGLRLKTIVNETEGLGFPGSQSDEPLDISRKSTTPAARFDVDFERRTAPVPDGR